MSTAPADRLLPEPTPLRPAGEIPRPESLPLPLTSFVGRDGEVDAILAAFARPGTRLMTMTGPGGVGKTRLAIQVAERIAGQFPDGVWFVPLASIHDPDLVAPAIAEVLPEEAGVESAEEHVKSVLRNARALLILDNFEHLLGASSLVADLLSACPSLAILVTSRAVLQVSCEVHYSVPALELPPVNGSGGLNAVLESESVRLFIERAITARFQLDVTSEVVEPIAAICRHLDGLPLAIELAAAWTNVLPPKALLERLSPRFSLLTRGPPTRQSETGRYATPSPGATAC